MKFLRHTLLLFVIPVLITFITKTGTANQTNPDTSASNILVLPLGYAMVPGPNIFVGPTANTARTYQLLIHQDQLTDFVGRDLIGVGFRLPTSAIENWPASDAVYATYNVFLSGSVPPNERSLTFALNVVGPQTQVRSGNLLIPAGTYRFGDVPNNFGPAIEFTSPYNYTGGHLLIEIRHSGSTATSRSVDAIGTSVTGYGTLFSACWASGIAATTGSQGNFAVTALIADDLVGIVGNSETPNDYSLKQNYPNPFNPVTTIQFSIPKNEFVTLKVFNALGQVVSNLVNTNLTAGTYDFSFDAAGLTSGIYFYELIAGDFKETKRMTLIK